eukprot:TRINITY_DN51452_c0_g1_i1.p1 TRINITY_DN51452_c0_g1~~TRINITY_DN51452_c0_g1_i1.p1  ORF type:complete len:416 (-),score=74.20 TRINITY_DN51452_c0_g1_i1:7-1218(-)
MQGYSSVGSASIESSPVLRSPLDHLSRGSFQKVVTACGLPSAFRLGAVASWARQRFDEDGAATWVSLLEAQFPNCTPCRPEEGETWQEVAATEFRIMSGWSLWAVLRRADGRAAVRQCLKFLGHPEDEERRAKYEDLLDTLLNIARPPGKVFLQVAGENPFRLTVQPTSEAWPEEDPEKPFEISTMCPGRQYCIGFTPNVVEVFMFTEMAFQRRLGAFPRRWFEVGPFLFPRPMDETVLLACILWELSFHLGGDILEGAETRSGLDCWKEELRELPMTPRTSEREARRRQKEQREQKAAKISAAAKRRAEKRASMLQRMNTRENVKMERRSQRTNDREAAREALKAERTERHPQTEAEESSESDEEEYADRDVDWDGGHSIRLADGVLILNGADPDFPASGKD